MDERAVEVLERIAGTLESISMRLHEMPDQNDMGELVELIGNRVCGSSSRQASLKKVVDAIESLERQIT